MGVSLRRKSSDVEKRLADTVARRERAERERDQAAVKLAEAREQADVELGALALDDNLDSTQYAQRAAEARTKVEAAEHEHDRARRAFDALSICANELAREAAAERVASHEADVAAWTAERDDLLAKVATIDGKLAEAERQLAVARHEASTAARYTPEGQARVAERQHGDEGRVAWYARHRATKPNEWPPELADRISAEVERLTAEYAATRERHKRESAESLKKIGMSDEDIAYVQQQAGGGWSWPRLSVR